MLRVGDAGVVQPGNEIADAELSLCLLEQSDPSAAVDAVRGHLVAMAHGGTPGNSQGAQRAGDMAHVVAPDEAAGVADALRHDIARREQKADNLQPARRQHEKRR